MASRFLPTKCFKLPSSIPPPRRNSRKEDGTPTSPPSTAAATASSSSRGTTRDTQLWRVFQRIDTDGDGRISPKEVRAILSCSSDDEENCAASVLQDEAAVEAAVGEMGYEEFVRLMEEGKGEEGDDDGGVRLAFTAFEAEKGSGCITADGLCRALHRLGEAWWTPEECAAMIRAYDADGNGVIDYHEFRAMMMSAA